MSGSTIRLRWVLIAFLFGFEAAAATGAENWIGAGVCVFLTCLFLGVGIWDSRREDRYVLPDPPPQQGREAA